MRKLIIVICLISGCSVSKYAQPPIIHNVIIRDTIKVIKADTVNTVKYIVKYDTINTVKVVIDTIKTIVRDTIIVKRDTPPDSTLYFMVFNNDTVYRQYPDTIITDKDTASNNWLSVGLRVEISGNKVLTAPDPKDFKYIKQIP
jgi:hypothetical protein